MPKKTRKMKQRAAMRRSSDAVVQPEIEQVAMATPSATPRTILAPASRVVTPATYDYSHIYSDLKRIALFAGFFFAVLIVLAFVIK